MSRLMKKEKKLEISGTDWERLRNMKDEDIDYSDIPPITDEMCENGVVRRNFQIIRQKGRGLQPKDKADIASK
jgi:hypothetical protein